MILDWVEGLRFPSGQDKHIFKAVVIPDCIGEGNAVALIDHRIMQPETNIFEMQRLLEACPRLRSVNSCVFDDPNDNPALLRNAEQFGGNAFKVEGIPLVIPQGVIGRTRYRE